MNFTDFVTHHGKRVNKDYFVSLIQVSKTDGKIDQNELEMLHKEGKKFGLTDPEIDKLINTESQHSFHSPYSLAEKFEQLYNVALMILADEEISESEKKMIKRFAIESGFNDNAVDRLLEILFEGIKNDETEEALLAKFKKNLF